MEGEEEVAQPNDHHDSDSDDEYYKDAENNIAHFVGLSAKLAEVKESNVGNIATDSLKVAQPAESHYSGFSFHNFGFHPTPFTDLMNCMVTMRNSYNESMAAYNQQKQSSHSKTKTKGTTRKSHTGEKQMFNIVDFQKTQEKTRTNHKISQFREAPLKWDMSAPDERLLKQLYRTYQSDASGKRIFNLSRDEAKGATPWKPAEFDKDFTPPPLSSLSPTFQKMVMDHLDSVIAQVEAEYERLPEKNQAQSEKKAKVGADLANLRRNREDLRRGVLPAAGASYEEDA
jgi:hypothetical protein